MIQRTYGQIKDALAEIAGNTGMPVTDARLITYTNEAVRELMNEGDWPGVVDRYYVRFDQTTGLLCLPGQFERLMSVTVDDVPQEMRSPWFEFVAYGPGNVRDEEVDSFGNVRAKRINWSNIVVDRGESPVKQDVPIDDGPWYVVIEGVVDEEVDGVAPVLNVIGLDDDGSPIRALTDGSGSDWGDGENLDIVQAVESTTTQPYAKITGISKPVTNGPVIVSVTNGVDTIELARLEYNDTCPSFRRYFLPNLWRETTGEKDRIVLARCRKRYTPIIGDNSIVMIGNEIALAEMMIAQWKRKTGAFDEYSAHKSTAIDIMKKESIAHNGRSRTPGLTFSKGFPIGGDISAIR